MDLAHGTRKQNWQPHVGACLAWPEIAAQYADGGDVHEVCIDLSGLTVREVDGSDRDNAYWVGDDEESLSRLAAEGVDVITYDDETEYGTSHRTWRLVSLRAVAACITI